jgi:zinc protease
VFTIMLNRKNQPVFKDIEEIKLPPIERFTLKNELELYLIKVPGTDILRIEFLFDAGNWYQEKNLIASTVTSMLLGGTRRRKEKEIAEIIDFYGAFIDLGIDQDYSWMVLYSLNKFLPEALEIVQDILKHANFPEENLTTYLGKRKQAFIVENQKVKNISKKRFAEVLFGENHPYGKAPDETDFDRVNRNDLISFFKTFYHPSRCRVFVSGAIEKDFVKTFSANFGNNNWSKLKHGFKPAYELSTSSEKIHFIRKEDAVQSALRIGCMAITKNHPDYIAFEVLNTVLGGYFGSRLMKNIREEKGYTYGIGSAIVSFKETGAFVVASEVGNEYCRPTITEIYNEIEKLKNDPVPEDELVLVRNFMIGDLMRSADGPFQVVDIWKSIVEFNLGEDYLRNLILEIKNTDAHSLKLLANKYFQKNSLIEVVAGN